MTLVTRFRAPAGITDMPAGSPFYDRWHQFLETRIADTTSGSAGGGFYDASKTDVSIAGDRQLTWMAFPRRLLLPSRRDDRNAAFVLAEDRNSQDEYCEWRTQRNAAGKITKVTFTCETPEYWEQLWAVDRATVVNLYRTLVSPAVVEADLRTSSGTYVRNNAWNGPNGIVHLIQSINTLNAALGLAQGSVNTAPAEDNYEVTPFANTSVDPRVQLDVGSLVRKGLWVTLADPIGLYMVGWDDTGWTKPNGTPVGNYWRILRGVTGMVLRLEYRVPPGLGFVVGDVRIGGRRIEYGGQIAEHVTMAIRGVAGVPS
jgi:hypothetical protein